MCGLLVTTVFILVWSHFKVFYSVKKQRCLRSREFSFQGEAMLSDIPMADWWPPTLKIWRGGPISHWRGIIVVHWCAEISLALILGAVLSAWNYFLRSGASKKDRQITVVSYHVTFMSAKITKTRWLITDVFCLAVWLFFRFLLVDFFAVLLYL